MQKLRGKKLMQAKHRRKEGRILDCRVLAVSSRSQESGRQ